MSLHPVSLRIGNTELQTILGPHDENLRVLEESCDCRVHIKDGEFVIESGDPGRAVMCKNILETLSCLVDEGHLIDTATVSSLCDTIKESDSPGAQRHFITDSIAIPQGFGKVMPRNQRQVEFLRALSSHDMIFGIGPAGTGKTYLAIAHALSEILSHRKKKLILTRPVVEAGESLGFLPGDMAQKLNPYVKPLYDAMDNLVPPEVVSRLEELRVIEIAPLAYMRGRSLKDCYVVLDEAQNTTREQMKMFLTRMGEGTRAVITGDITQIDLPSRKASGLVEARDVLSGIAGIHFSYFGNRDVVRSRLVRAIIEAYDQKSRKD